MKKTTPVSPLTSDLISIDPNDYKHDVDKVDFLGSYANSSAGQLLRSTNKVYVYALLQALKRSICWELPIFNDNHLPYYAITAYLEDKLTRQQVSHILEFYELKSTYPDIITIPILTTVGTLTCASKEYFDGLTRNEQLILPNITNAHIDHFLTHLLDSSKQTMPAFFVLYLLPTHDISSRYLGLSSLVGSIDFYKMGVVFMPSSVRNIFYQAVTPKNSTPMTSIGTLGKFDINAIEKGHRKNIRIHALGFPKTSRATRVHKCNLTLSDITAHDAVHQGAISYFPKTLYQMSLHCLDVIRNKTNIRWSKELWPLIDMFVIASDVNVFKEKVHRFATVYAVDDALSDSCSQQWIGRILKHILSPVLFNILLHDMVVNKSHWHLWTDVDNFIKHYDTHQITNTFRKPLTIPEIRQQSSICKQVTCGFIAMWPSIIHSILKPFIYFDKTEKKEIVLCLFGQPIEHYSESQLKAILMDVEQNNLGGIDLINAAISGNSNIMKEILLANNSALIANYLPSALIIAATNGHTNLVALILEKSLFDKPIYYYNALKKAAAGGCKESVELLLNKINDDNLAIKTIYDSLYLAIKYKKSAVVDVFLTQETHNLSGLILASNAGDNNIITRIFDYDDALTAKKIITYIAKKNDIQRIFDCYTIYVILRESPANCISILIDALIGHTTVTYQQLFSAIVKTGSLACAKQFIKCFEKKCQDNVLEKRMLLMDYILDGFLPIYINHSLTHQVNLHHEMVKFQIDHYLKLSAFDNAPIGPRKEDIKRLIERLFSVSATIKTIKFYTLSDIAIHYLVHHKLIKKNKELYTNCLALCIDKALHHQNVYYLRLLLRARVPLTFLMIQDKVNVNGVVIDEIDSPEVKCLLWLAYAVNNIKNDTNNLSMVKNSLQQASAFKTVDHELFSLIYGNSMPINVQDLAYLTKTYAYNDKIKQLMIERIKLLQEDKMAYAISQSNSTIFSTSPLSDDLSKVNNLNSKNNNYTY